MLAGRLRYQSISGATDAVTLGDVHGNGRQWETMRVSSSERKYSLTEK